MAQHHLKEQMAQGLEEFPIQDWRRLASYDGLKSMSRVIPSLNPNKGTPHGFSRSSRIQQIACRRYDQYYSPHKKNTPTLPLPRRREDEGPLAPAHSTQTYACTLCLDLTPGASSVPGCLVEGNLGDLFTSADGGCPLCSIFLEAVVKYHPDLLLDSPETRSAKFKVSGGFVWPVRMGVEMPSLPDESANVERAMSNIEFYTPPDCYFPYKAIVPAMDVPKNTLECLPRIQEWLQRCMQKHPGCHGEPGACLPRRVLDLGTKESNWHICLFEPEGDAKFAKYIALSYCWGDAQFIKTEKASIAERKQAISRVDLPLAFRQSIDVAHTLGIRYLWIDSLCIIQDDPVDWEEQAALMHEIYSAAILVIAASAASNPDGGLFYDNTSRRQGAFEIHRKLSDSLDITVCVRRPLAHDSAYVPPLDRRAWTMQESFVARRLVRFYQDELIFECESDAWCFCSKPSSAPRPKAELSRELLPMDYGGLFDAWHKFVEKYTQRSLTNDCDKLAALAAIAKKFEMQHYIDQLAPHINDVAAGVKDYGSVVIQGLNYAAGLWEEDILAGLCWFSERGPRQRPSTYIAPTWSWASVNGPVKFARSVSIASIDEQGQKTEAIQMGYIKSAKIDIKSVQCTPTYADPFISVSDAELVVSGQVIPVTYRLRPGQGYRYWCEMNGREEWFYADFSISHPWGDAIPEDGDILYCLNLGLIAWPPEPASKFRGLVMRKSTKRPAFERIGLIISSDHDASEWFGGVDFTELVLV